MGLFYYLRMLRAAYMTDSDTLAVPKMGLPIKLAIGICVAAVVGLGLCPRPLVEASMHAGEEFMGQAKSAPDEVPAAAVSRR